jgi:mono/diheme cytochrome c family protein
MKRAFNSGVARLAAIAILGALALAGCGGGADTTQNPVTGGPSAGPTYVGPAPATADIQAFRIEFWENVRGTNRCGNCHNAGGQMPNFARSDDVNAAYQQASAVVNRDSPSQSTIVTKVGGGHNCWLPDPGACASILTTWITKWVGATSNAGKQIELIAPTPKDPGSSRRFPATAPAAYGQVHTLLTTYCSNCHRSDATTPQSPFFAASDIGESYIAAIPKINLDNPAESRFVIRLGRESHNCWQNQTGNGKTDCKNAADVMQAAIQALADTIPAAAVDPSLVTSKALTLYDGTVASGGNRFDTNVIALYEFKTGTGSTAFDTSGVDPAADLNLVGQRVTDYDWVGGWGVVFKTSMAKAQASSTASRKFQQLITGTGEYSIEAWVVPGNVTQEDARIVSYSGSKTARNFTMSQNLYNYRFSGRSTATNADGEPMLSTADAAERLQASLQHVVMTFDPVKGRRIYVNGEFTGDADAAGGGTLGDWDNSFAFVLGNEVSNDRPWAGVVRLVAIHNRALTDAQIMQNFKAGVGEKFFMLFGVEHITGMAKSYVMFEATQYDSAGYLFTNPKFISLDAAAKPGSIPLKGMRIGVNGAEPHVGQAYRLLDTMITDVTYDSALGQSLSTVGTVIPLEHGPTSDEFYLCFDQLGAKANVCSAFASAVTSPPVDVAKPSDIGLRTFDGINATMAAVTGVSPNTATVKTAFNNVRQSLPAVVDINSFLASHQTSIAQLAITYCAALVDDTTARAAYFPGLSFTADITGQRNALINPLIARVIGTVGSQPTDAEARGELDSLITTLCTGGSCSSGARTPTVVKAVCGAAVGNAAVLVR